MDKANMIQLVKDFLDIPPEATEDTVINLFEYDSFTKVNLILVLEEYFGDNIDLEEFMACDSLAALIVLGDAPKIK